MSARGARAARRGSSRSYGIRLEVVELLVAALALEARPGAPRRRPRSCPAVLVARRVASEPRSRRTSRRRQRRTSSARSAPTARRRRAPRRQRRGRRRVRVERAVEGAARGSPADPRCRARRLRPWQPAGSARPRSRGSWRRGRPVDTRSASQRARDPAEVLAPAQAKTTGVRRPLSSAPALRDAAVGPAVVDQEDEERVLVGAARAQLRDERGHALVEPGHHREQRALASQIFSRRSASSLVEAPAGHDDRLARDALEQALAADRAARAAAPAPTTRRTGARPRARRGRRTGAAGPWRTKVSVAGDRGVREAHRSRIALPELALARGWRSPRARAGSGSASAGSTRSCRRQLKYTPFWCGQQPGEERRLRRPAARHRHEAVREDARPRSRAASSVRRRRRAGVRRSRTARNPCSSRDQQHDVRRPGGRRGLRGARAPAEGWRRARPRARGAAWPEA